MQQVTKTYVRYMRCSEGWTQLLSSEEVSSREIGELIIPESAHAFTFVDKTTVTLDDGRTFVQESNVSPPFIIGDLEGQWTPEPKPSM